MVTNSDTSAARERILDKAEQLFYAQGYQATGINQIISESGVAKATFYSHFPAKEELCVAYLERVATKEKELVESTLAKRRDAFSRYMTPLEVMQPWLIETNFRGCPFLNIASEVCDPKHPIRQVGTNFYAEFRDLIRKLTNELKVSDAKRYSAIKVEGVADSYMTIIIGAIGLCEVYHSVEPIKNALKMVKALVE